MTDGVDEEIRELRSLFWSDRDPEGRGFAPLADACRRAGELDEAEELIEDGLDRLPDFTSGHVVAGWVYRDRGAPKAARRAFDRALELDPENVAAIRGLGELAEAEGDREEALRHFRRLSGLDTSDETLRERIHALESGPAEAGAGEPESAAGSEAVEQPLPPEPAAEPRPPEPTAEPSLPESMAEPSLPEPAAESEALPAAEGPAGSTEPSVAEEGEISEDVVTATMAEIYARQGLTGKAAEVYRRLLEREPENERFRERLTSLESEAGESLTGGSAPSRTGADAASPPSSLDRLERAEEEAETLAEGMEPPGEEEAEVETPFAWEEEAAPPPSAPAEGATTIGWYFDVLLSWTPDAVPIETLAPDDAVPIEMLAPDDGAGADALSPDEGGATAATAARHDERPVVPIESLAPDGEGGGGGIGADVPAVVPIESLAPDEPAGEEPPPPPGH